MKLARCPKNHYYDSDKYSSCPHCAKNASNNPAKETSAPAAINVQPAVSQQRFSEVINNTKSGVKESPVQTAEKPAEAPVEEKSQIAEPVSVSVESKAQTDEPAAVHVESKAQTDEPVVASVEAATQTDKPVAAPVEAAAQTDKPAAAPVEEDKAQTDKPVATPVEEDKAQTDKQPATPKTVLTNKINETGFTGSMEDVRTKVLFEDIPDEPLVGWFVAIKGESKGKSYEIRYGRSTLGRSGIESTVDIDIHDDITISRGAQAVVVYDPRNKKFLIQTTNGKTFVYVNGEMLMNYTELKIYDVVSLGETDLIFVPLCSERFSWN